MFQRKKMKKRQLKPLKAAFKCKKNGMLNKGG